MKKGLSFISQLKNHKKYGQIFLHCDSETGEPEIRINDEPYDMKYRIDELKNLAILAIQDEICKGNHKYYVKNTTITKMSPEDYQDVVDCVDQMISVLLKYRKKHTPADTKRIDAKKAGQREYSASQKRKADMIEKGII